jgi:para-nitrobenzyl esterase
MRSLFLATMLAVTAPVAVYAQAAPKFSTAATTITDLLANAEAKAVLLKHIPQIADAGGMVGDQTLKQLQSMAPDRLTDKILADIDADLAKIK